MSEATVLRDWRAAKAYVLFFRHQFWARLLVNVGIVLVFLAFYFRFLKRP